MSNSQDESFTDMRCRRLWQSVLLQAFSDLKCCWNKSDAKSAQNSAYFFLHKPSSTLQIVCDMAGIPMSIVISACHHNTMTGKQLKNLKQKRRNEGKRT